MTRYRGTTGDLRIEADGEVSGMVNGTLTIAAGRHVRVSGMVNGALVVEAEADVVVSGMVSGAVLNHGGTVHVTGMVTAA